LWRRRRRRKTNRVPPATLGQGTSRKHCSFERYWKFFRSWKLNTRRSTQKIRKGDGPLKKLKESNQENTMEMLGSRWRVLIPVRGVYVLDRIVWCIIQGE